MIGSTFLSIFWTLVIARLTSRLISRSISQDQVKLPTVQEYIDAAHKEISFSKTQPSNQTPADPGTAVTPKEYPKVTEEIRQSVERIRTRLRTGTHIQDPPEETPPNGVAIVEKSCHQCNRFNLIGARSCWWCGVADPT